LRMLRLRPTKAALPVRRECVVRS